MECSAARRTRSVTLFYCACILLMLDVSLSSFFFCQEKANQLTIEYNEYSCNSQHFCCLFLTVMTTIDVGRTRIACSSFRKTTLLTALFFVFIKPKQQILTTVCVKQEIVICIIYHDSRYIDTRHSATLCCRSRRNRPKKKAPRALLKKEDPASQSH